MTAQYEPLSEILPTPTPEQIATLDPNVDFETAYAAGVTFAHSRAHIETFACPRPRCGGYVGHVCITPNGYLAAHKERADLAYGRVKPKRKPRLTDRQAEWLECAAETSDHLLYAPDQYATLSGEAAARKTADAMEAAGLIVQVGTGPDGCERIFELTEAGWATYWTHRLVIRRRLDHLNHPVTCPCRATRPADNAA